MHTSKTELRNHSTQRVFRVNPLRNLQPHILARHLDAFQAGYLRDAAAVWEALEQRDDLLRGVISKRKKSVARYGWTVLPKDNLSAAEQQAAREHQQALEFFYSRLECENALDESEQGGFKLLARQMMDAVGKRFAVHELVWRAAEAAGGTNRRFVTAKFRFVPLGFFENTTGRLRFLESDSAVEGRPLEPGAWMITVGEGLMIASSIAWMIKNIALNDWLKCSERNGTPGLRGVSPAVRGSADWQAMEQALEDLQNGRAVVHGTSEEIHVVDLLAGGNMPFPKLVERMDRMMATLWRGADLSTLSRDRGYGASLQEKETCALEEDDAEMLTETLNRYVDEWVIKYVFGDKVRPLAQVKVLVSPRECTAADLQVDEFLLRHGAPLGIEATMNRYGRALPKAGEKVFLRSISGSSEPARGREPLKASFPESLQNSGMALDYGDNGRSVSFRGRSPADFEEKERDGRGDVNPRPGDEAADGAAPSLCNAKFTITQPEWLQLSPYGDFPHTRGLQRVDRGAAERMAAQFESWSGRLGRLFGGVPIYVGHPDTALSSDAADRRAYGWVLELQAREDGLYGRAKWSDAGLELLRNGHFKFLSPYWEAKEVAAENGRRVYQPIALLSVGLTNQPNLPVRPLANEATEHPVDGELPAERNECSPDASSAGEAAAATTPVMHTVSCTNELGARRLELQGHALRHTRIREAVLVKVRLGLGYDEAWDAVKREHPLWFAD